MAGDRQREKGILQLKQRNVTKTMYEEENPRRQKKYKAAAVLNEKRKGLSFLWMLI